MGIIPERWDNTAQDLCKASLVINLTASDLKHRFKRKRSVKTTSRRSTNPTAAIEKKRLDLIQRLTTCQNRILFEVSDTDLVTRLVLFALQLR
jgi:uncharacterized protein (UPF0218 family)